MIKIYYYLTLFIPAFLSVPGWADGDACPDELDSDDVKEIASAGLNGAFYGEKIIRINLPSLDIMRVVRVKKREEAWKKVIPETVWAGKCKKEDNPDDVIKNNQRVCRCHIGFKRPNDQLNSLYSILLLGTFDEDGEKIEYSPLDQVQGIHKKIKKSIESSGKFSQTGSEKKSKQEIVIE